MGLDSVELVMAWEEVFGVSVSDSVASQMRTTCDAIEYFYGQLPHAADERCLTQRTFYLLRRALIEATSMPHRQVTPTARLKQLLPAKGWRETWAHVAERSPFRHWPSPSLRFGKGPTLREVTRQVLATNVEVVHDRSNGWTRRQVREVVRAVLCEQVGLDDTFADDAELVADLGID
jgi:acyl carrier protein